MRKIIFCFFIFFAASFSSTVFPKKEELNYVGDLIYRNETGRKKELLVHWNQGEEFPSLGIGHFIWYPENFKEGRFKESFPELIQYFQKKNIPVPKIFKNNRYAPWENITEFRKEKSLGKLDSLTDFLYDTRDIQVEFIFLRLQESLEKMKSSSSNPEHIEKQFYRIANSPNGLYPLIDYVNFKGEGTEISERYNGYGWGLLQILELMQGEEPGIEALKEFSDYATFVLERRIENSPKERGEERWRNNWKARVRTYSTTN